MRQHNDNVSAKTSRRVNAPSARSSLPPSRERPDRNHRHPFGVLTNRVSVDRSNDRSLRQIALRDSVLSNPSPSTLYASQVISRTRPLILFQVNVRIITPPRIFQKYLVVDFSPSFFYSSSAEKRLHDRLFFCLSLVRASLCRFFRKTSRLRATNPSCELRDRRPRTGRYAMIETETIRALRKHSNLTAAAGRLQVI